MKHEKLIINGVTYVPENQEEKKPKRLEGWVERYQFNKYDHASITTIRHGLDDTRMIEIREGEIITTKDAIIKACINSYGEMNEPEAFFEEL